ncbi:pyridoxamine 5'-phosphate oxidase family protein [Kribbella sp. NBC_00889]|uniref:pyridoxamine 5'-phosphate oxidase family protein n=1 Tax=Kribbella sp. NBC_00889 TaxID=2975974 RepID=UPI00386C6B4D|nr:helix-turn-helix domain-containing protein [Kribbella sp. NBC_00889]
MAATEQPSGGDLAGRVRRRRGVLGLTREGVAARARMDPAYLAHVEQAPVAMTTGALIRLADALDTTVSGLLGADPTRPPDHGRTALHPILDEMREQESLHLIESGGIGRIAFASAGRLTVVPVNFIVHHGDIVFRSAATSAIGQYDAGKVEGVRS